MSLKQRLLGHIGNDESELNMLQQSNMQLELMPHFDPTDFEINPEVLRLLPDDIRVRLRVNIEKTIQNRAIQLWERGHRNNDFLAQLQVHMDRIVAEESASTVEAADYRLNEDEQKRSAEQKISLDNRNVKPRISVEEKSDEVKEC